MTLLIKLENGAPIGYPLEEQNFRQLFPNTSFPSMLTESVVEPYGYGVFDWSNTPETRKYEKVVELVPEKNEFGIWRQTFMIVQMNSDEQVQADAEQVSAIRRRRNALLSECDWTQLPDATVDKIVWQSYRAALRDISVQEGFPWDVIWPTPPFSF